MANRILKTAGGVWSAASTWSATSASGVDNAGAPTAADNAIAELLSGNLTIDGTAAAPNVCRSFDVKGGVGTWAGTLTKGATARLDIGDATAGPGNIALRLDPGITCFPNVTSDIRFISSSATQQTVDFGGKTMGNINFTSLSVSCNYALVTAVLQDPLATIFHGRGALHFDGTADTAGLTHAFGIFSTSTNNTRTLLLGASISNISGAGNAWNGATGTLLTVTPGTSVINMLATAQTFQNGGTAGAQPYNTVNLTAAGAQTVACGTGGSFVNLNRTGTATKTDSLVLSSGTTKVTGLLTLQGNAAINRLFVRSSAAGATKIVDNTGATVDIDNVVFEDMDFVVAIDLSAQDNVSDLGGNSDITFPANSPQTWQGTSGGSWSDITKWTSRVPLAQDDVVINNAFSAAQTILLDMPHAGRNLDFSAATGTPTFNGSANPMYYTGSLTLPTSNIGNANRIGSSVVWHSRGRGAVTMTSNGKTISPQQIIANYGGSYTLLDALTKDSAITIVAGTFSDGGFNVTCSNVLLSAQDGIQNVRTINFTGNWTVTTFGNAWNFATLTNVTITSLPASINVTNVTTSQKVFLGGGLTYPNVIIADGGGSELLVTGANTFTNFKMGDGRTLTLPASTTTTFTNPPDLSGTPYGYLRLPGVSGHYVSSPDSAALDIVSDIDIRVQVALIDWTPAATTTLLSKFTSSGNQRSYVLRVSTAGLLQLTISNDGTASNTANSSVATGVTDGAVKWVRVTWVDSTNQVQFFTSNDGVNWTQLGTNQSLSSVGIFSGTAPIEIGSETGGTITLANANFYRAQVYSGVAGTLVFDADFTTKVFGVNSFNESSSNAALVTINGVQAIVGDGRVALQSSISGTQHSISSPSGPVIEDYMTIKDSNALVAMYFAGSHSVDLTGNTNWSFMDYVPRASAINHQNPAVV